MNAQTPVAPMSASHSQPKRKASKSLRAITPVCPVKAKAARNVQIAFDAMDELEHLLQGPRGAEIAQYMSKAIPQLATQSEHIQSLAKFMTKAA